MNQSAHTLLWPRVAAAAAGNDEHTQHWYFLPSFPPPAAGGEVRERMQRTEPASNPDQWKTKSFRKQQQQQSAGLGGCGNVVAA